MMMFSKRLRRMDPLAAHVSSARRLPCGNTDSDVVVLGRGDGGPLALPLARLAQNIAVTGAPGMGKTSAVVGIAEQLRALGINLLVLEPAKREYAAALARLSPRVFGDDGQGAAERLETNAFYVDEGVSVLGWIEDITTAIADSYGAAQEETGPLYLRALIARLYGVCGIHIGSISRGDQMAWPTIKTYLNQVDPYVRQEVCSGREVTANIRGFLMARGRSMATCRGLISNRGLAADDLLGDGCRVIQLCDYGRDSGHFLGMVLLLRIIDAARAAKGRRPLHTVVILEEAHSLFRDALTGEATMFSRIYESALAELRSAGIGFITVEQRPSLLPAGVLANSVTKLAFASTHGDDRDAVEKAMGLDERQKRRFGELAEGRALLATAGRAAVVANTFD